ncbi:hypothetical protein HPB49_011801 [Dermacentor silvarum]|uniref:Uncharacterized protein n=1 Tax=Dermacentor silvarum TaxID=543639 RepID=A0ACB8DD45_DERSI|nr:hypothetical protein HPB49_011801 [Dermacentor silvarum]
MALKEVWELPKDGVCDFTFYQARERVRALLDSSKSKRDARLELLFRTAAMHVKTEYGVSFDYETRDILPKLLSEDALAQDSLESFWKKKIYHYAYLTLPYFDLDDTSYKSVYYALKDSAHWALQELPKRHLGHTRFFLSVALGGRVYDTPEKQAFLAKSGTDAGTPLWIDMAKVCGNTSWVEGFHDTTPIGAYYENVNASKMVTYDNDRSFRDKLCRGKKSLLKANYGLVAYNVHLDDANNKCRTGGYKHLKFLRKLERFLNERFVADYDYDECTKLWGGIERK